MFEEMAKGLNCVEDHDYYIDKENCYEKKTAKIRKRRQSQGSVGEDEFLRDITRKIIKRDRRKVENTKANWYSGIGLKNDDS